MRKGKEYVVTFVDTPTGLNSTIYHCMVVILHVRSRGEQGRGSKNRVDMYVFDPAPRANVDSVHSLGERVRDIFAAPRQPWIPDGCWFLSGDQTANEVNCVLRAFSKVYQWCADEQTLKSVFCAQSVSAPWRWVPRNQPHV